MGFISLLSCGPSEKFGVSWNCAGIILLWSACFGLCLDNTEFQKSFPEKVIWGVLGRSAELPCDVTPPVPSDSVKMVFWFKDNVGMPWYSLDARSGLSHASHLTISGDLGNRLYFIMDENPAQARLKIENVSVHDQGMYRCRVDFVNSPTRNFQVNLSLIEQPSSPRVFDAEGSEIRQNASAGPFLEDDELFLSCQVTGGKPRPVVTWWHGNSLLDGVVDSSSNSFTTVNQLFISHVSRELKGARFECRATSSEIAGHVTRIIPLVVYLKPNKVKIVTPNELMSNRKSQNIKCETSGSYPPAKLTWLLDGKSIKQSIVTEEETEFFTASILTLTVSAEDDGKELLCRADNPRFPGGRLEDSRVIHVAYPPKVRVQLDSELSLPAKEGAEVRLKCEGQAQPSANNYRWYHNGHIVQFNSTSGVFPMDDVLIMKHVDRKSAGQYACSAANTEGETYSATFDLQIQFTPRCKKGHEVTRVGAIPQKKIQVQCHVESVPEVNRFYWTYNTSRNVLRVQGSKMENKGGVSTLYFEVPPAENEIQSLSCWAANDLGPQDVPCLFILVPATIPEKPRNCVYTNSTEGGALRVICRPGRDGGLPQSFVLEVKDVTPINPPSSGVSTLSDQGEEAAPPAFRFLGERPEFELRSLQPGREYQVSVFAENARGRSTPYEIMPSIRVPLSDTSESGRYHEVVESNTTNQKASRNLTPIYIVLASCGLLLVIVIITAVSILACRKPSSEVVVRPKKARTTKNISEEFELNSEAGFGSGFHRRSAEYRASMYGTEDIERRISSIVDRPDLILSPRGLRNMNEEDEI
ncbi:hemicentin-1 [Coccinella septempunctata]|uniref:hemicentin-1 n=1 Tax=Coccinella septempunctata TaxID=41139 RepID=UPI001D07E452|nr:hemicentin-1 [Coccinella septempunctata]